LIDELHIGAAHAGRADFDENLIGLDVRDRHIFQNHRLVVTVQTRSSHDTSPE
jgi:hypothetical protein